MMEQAREAFYQGLIDGTVSTVAQACRAPP